MDPGLCQAALRDHVLGISSVYQIAASSHLDHALLDMVLGTSLTRRFWDDYWQAEVFGDSMTEAQVDASLQLVDTIMRRLPPPDPDAPPKEPIRAADIERLTAGLGGTTAQLESLVTSDRG